MVISILFIITILGDSSIVERVVVALVTKVIVRD